MSSVRVTEAERGLASLSKTVKVTDRLVPIGRLVLSAQAVMPADVNLYAASKHRRAGNGMWKLRLACTLRLKFGM